MEMPWEYVLSKQWYQTDKENTQLSDLGHLLESYNRVSEELVVKDRRVVVVNKLVFPDSREDSHWVIFPAMVSRILVTFLSEGGRDYCGLCKNCGKFILAQRRGQRESCDGRCRIAYKRAKEREAEGLS